jgi:drug/metabolite transporter (DMT)-like permease
MARLPVFALIVGTLAVSTAPPLIVLAGIDAFSLAAWRLMAVALIFLPIAGTAMLRDWRNLRASDRAWLVFSGALYGAHFGLFNLAFEHTSKESVVVLLGAQPLMAALIGALWLAEPITRRMLTASGVALLGLAIFIWHDYTFDASHLIGDAIVLSSGLVIVISYSIGRRLRPRMSLLGYLGALYWIGGLACIATAALVGDSLLGFEGMQWVWLIGVIVVPTLVGHSLFHYVVKYVPVFYVNLSILGEPIIALIIMYALRHKFEAFQESTLTLLQIIGGSLLLAGVAIGLLQKRMRTVPEPKP